MIGLIPMLKYGDDDITNENKFPELVPKNFLRKYISVEIDMIVIEP